jgi:hypothetical protein
MERQGSLTDCRVFRLATFCGGCFEGFRVHPYFSLIIEAEPALVIGQHFSASSFLGHSFENDCQELMYIL